MNKDMRSEFDRPGAWREITGAKRLNGGDVEGLKAENEALRAELSALKKAQGGSKL